MSKVSVNLHFFFWCLCEFFSTHTLCVFSVFQLSYEMWVFSWFYSWCAPEKTHGCEKSFEICDAFSCGPTPSILVLKNMWKTFKKICRAFQFSIFPCVEFSEKYHCSWKHYKRVIKAGSLSLGLFIVWGLHQRSALLLRGCVSPGWWSLVTTGVMTKFCTTGSWRRRGTVTSLVTSLDGGWVAAAAGVNAICWMDSATQKALRHRGETCASSGSV